MNRDLWHLLGKLMPRSRLLSVQLFSALVGLLDVLTIMLVFPLLILVLRPDNAVLPEPFASVLGARPDSSLLYLLGGGLILLLLLKNVLLAATMGAQVRLAQNMANRLANRLIRGYLRAPLEYHMCRSSAQITRAVRDLPLEICFSGWLALVNRVAEIAGVAAIVVALAVIEPMGVLGASVVFLVLVLANHYLLGPRVQAWGLATGLVMRRLYALVTDVFPNLKVIRTTGAEQQIGSRFAAGLGEIMSLNAKNRFVQLAIRPVSEIVMLGAGVVLLAALLWQGDAVIDIIPALAAFVYAAFRLLPAVNRIAAFTNELRRIRTYIAEVERDLAEQETFGEDTTLAPAGPTIRFRERLELRDVSYSYPGSAEPVLRDVNLSVAFGEVIGLAGESGAGKSTLVDILLGLLEPSGGAMLLDGAEPTREGYVRGTVGYVPQNSLLLDISARENIALGHERSAIDEQRIAEVVRLARLEDILARLPGGLDGHVGEHGSRLSGGQRQRFGIARAIYDAPSLLVLDEATSDLDSRTEFEVSEAINRMRGSTTMFIVAHRMHLLKPCDRILFMSEGRIAAEGDFNTLLRTCPGFAELVQMTDRYEPLAGERDVS